MLAYLEVVVVDDDDDYKPKI